MNNANLYDKANGISKNDALKVLEEYETRIDWQKAKARIMDVGCGEGTVTVDILSKYLPGDFQELIGSDISENMIKYANARKKDNRIQFLVQDIEDDLLEELLGRFDYVFSFYALHWIRNIEFALANIYKLLKDDGVCLLAFLGNYPVFEAYRILSRNRRWGPWFRGAERYLSPHHDSPDPVTEIKTTLKQIGFKDIHVTCDERTYTFDSFKAMEDTLTAVLPFKIPESLRQEFMNEYVGLILELIKKNFGDQESHLSPTFRYTLPVIYAKK